MSGAEEVLTRSSIPDRFACRDLCQRTVSCDYVNYSNQEKEEMTAGLRMKYLNVFLASCFLDEASGECQLLKTGARAAEVGAKLGWVASWKACVGCLMRAKFYSPYDTSVSLC